MLNVVLFYGVLLMDIAEIKQLIYVVSFTGMNLMHLV